MPYSRIYVLFCQEENKSQCEGSDLNIPYWFGDSSEQVDQLPQLDNTVVLKPEDMHNRRAYILRLESYLGMDSDESLPQRRLISIFLPGFSAGILFHSR